MKDVKWYFLTGFTVLILITTMFIRIPIPNAGYFNFGDVAVVFCGLVLGKWGGLFAGGVGSALADILGGYAFFSPITLVAKGLEGFFSGLAKDKSKLLAYIFPAIGCLLMVAVYFVGECFLPQIKYQGAIAELIPNLIQAIGGYIGGRILFIIYNRIS